uniref:FACT complex subunit SSRP1 n=1 Tax=Meloidogyne incognita TaxID=6306 RepID=A0A914MJ70_MELIC
MADTIEFANVFQEEMGGLNDGFLKFSKQGVQFKSKATGKLMTISPLEIDQFAWQKLGNKPGIKVITNQGVHHRFGGLKESDFDKISNFVSSKLESSLKRNDLSLKGWNYGETEFEGQNLIFNIGEKIAFEVPLSNVMRCVGTKSEAIVEFIANEESPVQLTEMRFHIPQDPENEDQDIVEEFRKEVMRFAEVESEKDQAIVTLPDILLATPRGRYEIKVFPNHLSFHGKSYDYKIPLKTIMRMFLLSHKDGRHMYFVLHINPPIRQGQTRYPFLVLEFSKEDHIELDLCLTEEEYNKLFDYVQSKGLKIRNAQRLGEKSYKEDKFAASSDEELDPYKEKLKDDARERAANSDSDSEDDWLDLGVELLVLGKSSDSETEQFNRIEKSSVLQSGGPTTLQDYDMEKDLKKREKEKESSEGSGSEPDEEYDSSAAASVSDDLMDGGGETEKTTKKSEKKKKERKDKKEKVTKKGGGEKNDKKEKKKKKDPNAPKRNQTAFFLWQTENRSKIKKEGDTIAETATRAGQMWKEMSAEDKQPYEQKAKEDKERYEREMKIYKDKKQKSDEESNNDEDDEPSTSAKATSKASSSKPSTTKPSTTKSSAKNSSPIKKPISKEFVDDSTDSSSISD